MRFKNNNSSYGTVSKTFHWIIALLVFGLFGLGWYMTGLPIGPELVKNYNLHKSIGVLVLCLAVLRLLWRLLSPPPSLPEGMSNGEKFAAKAAHFLLYVLLFLQPVIGLLGSWAANFPVVVFGAFVVPQLVGPDEQMKEFWTAVHFWSSWLLLALIVLHVAAAIRHHFIIGDNTLRRMLPGVSE